MIGAAAHEECEVTLIMPGCPPVVLPDSELYWGFFRWRSNNRTRWFRDGLANYASHIMMRHVLQIVARRWPNRPVCPRTVNYASLDALATVGTDLLDWSQFEDEGAGDYYPAAGGLVFLMVERFGEAWLGDFIRRIGSRSHSRSA